MSLSSSSRPPRSPRPRRAWSRGSARRSPSSSSALRELPSRDRRTGFGFGRGASKKPFMPPPAGLERGRRVEAFFTPPGALERATRGRAGAAAVAGGHVRNQSRSASRCSALSSGGLVVAVLFLGPRGEATDGAGAGAGSSSISNTAIVASPRAEPFDRPGRSPHRKSRRSSRARRAPLTRLREPKNRT